MSTLTATAPKLTKKQLKAEQWRKKSKASGAEDGKEVKKGKGRSPRSIAKEKKLLKARELAEKAAREVESGEVAVTKPAAEITATPVAKEKKVKKDKKRKSQVEEASSEANEANEAKQETKSSGSDKKKSKRKREEEGESEPVKRTKKRFNEDGQVEEVKVEDQATAAVPIKEEEEKKDDRRFIVFVGNMSFQSTAEEIAKHFFSHCGEKPSVRLLTSKGDPSKLAQLSKAKQKSIAKGKASDPSAPTSKGCAFLEFETPSALQKALQYHHTQFQGRNINVELTAGGGGKGTDRKEKIKKKNQNLEVERQKLHEKYVKGQKKDKKDDGETKADEPEKERLPAWGPRASSSAKNKGTTKIPRWAASGSNAVRLSA